MLFWTTATCAASFAASVQSTYLVMEASGSAKVNHDFTVTNTTPTTFVDSYQIILDRDNLNNLIVDPKNEDIAKDINRENGQTKISLKFNNEVVGEGRKRAWSVIYDDPNIANFTGQVAEINIPLLANDEQYHEYGLILKVPSRLGEPSKINLEPDNIQAVGGGLTQYTWKKLGDEKQLTMTFGARQVIDFQLRYQLFNQSGDVIYQQIALPGDDAWQTLNYQQISPLPESLNLDFDGNYLATYRLTAGEELIVNAGGQAILIEKNQIPSSVDTDKYLSAANFWEIKDESVQAFASKAGDVRGIYQYLTNEFSYLDNETQMRRGARQALADKSGVCEDFVDVFVAAARAQGTPARRVIGWTNESNNFTLHVWAEWYDNTQETWRRADPTFGNTSKRDYFDNFDLFHFALVKNGYYGSELPKAPQEVSVKYAEPIFDQTDPLAAPKLELKARRFGFLPIPGFYDLLITNTQGRTIYGLYPEFFPDNTDVRVSLHQSDSLTLLPFQTQTLALSVYNQHWLQFWQLSELKASLQNNVQDLYVETSQNIISFSFIGLAGIAACVAFAFTAWSILVARRKK